MVCRDGDTEFEARPQTGSYVDVITILDHNCALHESGLMDCWDKWGTPLDGPDGTFVQIEDGVSGHCGIREGGSIDCWGEMEEPARPDGAVECWGSPYFGQPVPP